MGGRDWRAFLESQCGGVSSAARSAVVGVLTAGGLAAAAEMEAVLWRQAREGGPGEQPAYVQGVIDILLGVGGDSSAGAGGLDGHDEARATGEELRARIFAATSNRSDALFRLVERRLAEERGAPPSAGLLRCRSCGQDTMRTRTEQRRAADEGATEIRWCDNAACASRA